MAQSQQSIQSEDSAQSQQSNTTQSQKEASDLDSVSAITNEQQDVSVAEQVSEETSTSTEDKPKRQRSSRHGVQQLVVQNVHADGTVECQLLNKQKTISFKFNRLDTSPQDIVQGLVKEELLKQGVNRGFSEQLKDIIKQLKENPEKVPMVHQPYVQKVLESFKSIKMERKFCVYFKMVNFRHSMVPVVIRLQNLQ